MKIDPKFTKEIQDWLNKSPHKTEDAIVGAQLLQRINPRNSMYRRFVSLSIQRPVRILPKIEYELNIHLKYRLDGLTLQEVNRLDHEVIPEAEKIISKGIPETDTFNENESEIPKLGRRVDHDRLPDNIRQLWNDNGILYKDIKSLFEELKSMDQLPSCQRYDKLQLLASMDSKYLSAMEQYDNFIIGGEKKAQDVDSAKQALSVTSARSYISRNLGKLATLKKNAEIGSATSKEREAYSQLLNKMQARVDILISANAVVGDEIRQSLIEIGIKFDEENTDNSETSE